MTTLLKPGDTSETADMEVIDVLEDPSATDADAVLSHVSRISDERAGAPEVNMGALERALKNEDQVQAIDILSPFRRHRSRKHFRVVDSGFVQLGIPFLAAAAPAVDQAKVTAEETRSRSGGAEFSFKVAGTGIDASAKLTVQSGYAIACAAGETLQAEVLLPFEWQKRADPDNEERNWLYLAPCVSTKSIIRVKRSPYLNLSHPLSTASLDNTEGGQLPSTASENYTFEEGFEFSVGLKFDAVGIDTSLTVSSEHELAVALGAELPSGHVYRIAWLGDPPGVSVAIQ